MIASSNKGLIGPVAVSLLPPVLLYIARGVPRVGLASLVCLEGPGSRSSIVVMVLVSQLSRSVAIAVIALHREQALAVCNRSVGTRDHRRRVHADCPQTQFTTSGRSSP